MDLKPRKANTAVGIILFIIVLFALSVTTTCVLCQLASGTSKIPEGCGCSNYLNLNGLVIALAIGIIGYIIASFCCCRGKNKGGK